MKTIIFLFLLLDTCFYCHSQDAKLDSLITILGEHSERDSTRIESLLAISEYHRAREFGQSLPYLTEAREIARSKRLDKWDAIVQRYLAQHYRLKGLYAEALVYAIASEKILDSLGMNQETLLINSELGILYQNTNNFQKALEVHLGSIEIVKNDPPSGGKARHYFNAGYAFSLLKQLEKAEQYYHEAMKISRESNFIPGEMVVLSSIGQLYVTMGRYESARNNLNKVLPYFEKSGQLPSIAGTYYNLARIHSLRNEYSESIPVYEKSLRIYEQIGSLNFIKEINYELFIAYSVVQDFEKAAQANETYKSIKDSVDSQDKRKLIADLQTKYETEKKEAEIELLSQKSSIQALEIKQKNQVIILGLIAILFVLAVIYFLYKQRETKKQQAQIELEQRFLRSQLNPHFISNALVAVQNFMLKNNSEAAALYLTKFSKLMREILENSRREFIPVEEEINMLTNYLDIHKLRLNDGFDYAFELGENIDLETDTIPPMFIQPFLENAIEHGINPAEKKGKITLSFEKQGEYISINVIDNGRGLESKVKSTDHTSLSTTIIRERIEQFNKTLKSKIQLVMSEITNDIGEIEGTKVELKVPFSYI